MKKEKEGNRAQRSGRRLSEGPEDRGAKLRLRGGGREKFEVV